MSTPRTRSRSQSGHRDSETRTNVARWAPCVLSCLPSFWHCYTCSRLPTEVRPLNLSALRLISQCSIILHVFEYLKAVQKFLKVALLCILQEYGAQWRSFKHLKVCVEAKVPSQKNSFILVRLESVLPVYTINPQFGVPSFSRFRWGLFACIGQSGSGSRRSEVLK